MKIVPAMIDMARSDEEKAEVETEMSAPPTYPYGLCISLCEDELEKLDLGDEEVQVGDMIHMHCMATVTSVSKSANASGSFSRVELQITHIAAESEDSENEEEDKPKSVAAKFYSR